MIIKTKVMNKLSFLVVEMFEKFPLLEIVPREGVAQVFSLHAAAPSPKFVLLLCFVKSSS